MIVLVAALVGVALPGRAEAADGYTLTSATTYRVDPAAPAVTVETTYRMTNTTPDVRLSGGGTRYYFYDGVKVPLEAGAADVTVEVNGRAAQYEQVDDIDGFKWLDVSFESNLRYGKTATIVVRHALEGAPPRTEASFIRVNPAYVSFPVVAYGDDGGADVTVVIPDDWVPDYVGDDLRLRVEPGIQIYEATGIESPQQFFTVFTARQDERLESRPISVGDSSFELRGWPGDEQWRSFAEREISKGIPLLEQLTGTAWPESAETDVIEASTPYLRGYAGYYYADDDVIEVGEELDSHTMLHELSHAWFNDSALGERWLSEGLADEIGARAVAALGDPLPSPDEYEITGSVNRATFHLNTWSNPFGDSADAVEMYGYKQSFRVLRALTDEIGQDKMTAVVAAVLRGDRAYGVSNGTTTSGEVVGWREFLDLAEQVGGSQQLVELYRNDVITPYQVDDLDNRAGAVDAYHALVARSGGWDAPEGLRAAMAAWLFESADDDIDDANTALDLRDALEDELASLGLTPQPTVEVEYEQADELDGVIAELTDQDAAAGRLVTAQSELSRLLPTIEQDVPIIDQSAYAAAPIDIAGEREQLVERADELVDATAALDATLDTFDLTVPELASNAFVLDPAGAIETIAGYQRAAEAVDAAHARHAEQPSFVERMGEVGSTADTLLAHADAQLAIGNVDGAITAADSARHAYDNWADRGRERLETAAITYGGVLLLVIIGLLIFGRSRPAGRDLEPAAAAGQTWPDATAGDAADPADAGEVGAVDPDG